MAPAATLAAAVAAAAVVATGGSAALLGLLGAFLVALCWLAACIVATYRSRSVLETASQRWTIAVLVLVGSGVAAGGLLLRGPVVPVGLAAALLVALWWLQGARQGRRLVEAISASVALSLAANFFSSWFGVVAGVPAGAVLRDVAFVLLIASAVSESSGGPNLVSRLVAYAALVVVVVASVDIGGGLASLVGARTYLLYPILLLTAVWRLTSEQRQEVAENVTMILGFAAVMGLLEVATRGQILTALGFNAGFAETATAQLSPYFAGFRRATGGVGNYLEFGLLMDIGLLMARASLRGAPRTAATALFSTAAFFSWSRLSWVLVLVIAAAPFGLIGEGRVPFQLKRVSGAVLVALVAAVFLTLGPSQVVKDRLLGQDRVTQRSNVTREYQFSLALSDAGSRITGTGPGTQGAAADRQVTGIDRTVTDNGYLVWLLELGWVGIFAISLSSILIIAALWAARAWWALLLVGVLAVANAFFTAADSRVVLVISFVGTCILWTGQNVEPDVAEESMDGSDRVGDARLLMAFPEVDPEPLRIPLEVGVPVAAQTGSSDHDDDASLTTAVAGTGHLTTLEDPSDSQVDVGESGARVTSDFPSGNGRGVSKTISATAVAVIVFQTGARVVRMIKRTRRKSGRE